MSHTLTVQTKFHDPAAVEAAAREMTAEILGVKEHALYQSKHTGLGIKLPGWEFPVIVDTKTGAAHYDNYNGSWGEQSKLDRFTQLYAVHKTTLEARRKGWLVTRQQQPNGNISLQLTGM